MKQSTPGVGTDPKPARRFERVCPIADAPADSEAA